MAPISPGASTRSSVLGIVRALPAGRVTTYDAIANEIGASARHVAHVLATLSEDEREAVAWHRVVAKGGAIGYGPHRDAQFARLVREGVPVSPAGIVQDMSRLALSDVTVDALRRAGAHPPETAPAERPAGRSRGMKDRP